eukprot:1071553-Prorocentrum_minimum.AAC.1
MARTPTSSTWCVPPPLTLDAPAISRTTPTHLSIVYDSQLGAVKRILPVGRDMLWTGSTASGKGCCRQSAALTRVLTRALTHVRDL